MIQATVQLRREFTSSCKRPSQHLYRLLETKSGVDPPRCPCSLPASRGAGGGEGTTTPQPRLPALLRCQPCAGVFLG